MPTYEYRCTKCGHDFETFQKFSDEPLTICPRCGAELRKVFNSVGVVFKGSGFYSTDQRSPDGKSTSSSLPPAKTESSDAVTPATAKTDKESSAPSKTSASPSSPDD